MKHIASFRWNTAGGWWRKENFHQSTHIIHRDNNLYTYNISGIIKIWYICLIIFHIKICLSCRKLFCGSIEIGYVYEISGRIRIYDIRSSSSWRMSFHRGSRYACTMHTHIFISKSATSKRASERVAYIFRFIASPRKKAKRYLQSRANQGCVLNYSRGCIIKIVYILSSALCHFTPKFRRDIYIGESKPRVYYVFRNFINAPDYIN